MNARVIVFAVGLAMAAGVMAGCTATPAAISEGASGQMQTTVVSIADSAAAGDVAGALAQLDVLQQQLDAALADGSVSAERAAAIQTRIDLVRADLQPAPAVDQPAEPTGEPAEPTADPAEPTTEPEPSTEPAPDPVVTEDEGGNENSGPGNNSGNDKKDEDKGKGKGEGD